MAEDEAQLKHCYTLLTSFLQLDHEPHYVVEKESHLWDKKYNDRWRSHAHRHNRWDKLVVSSGNKAINHHEGQIYGGQIHGISEEDKKAS